MYFIPILKDCKLLVVGDILEAEKDFYTGIIGQTGCEDSIILINEYVPDDRVEYYFSACDVVVLPYESATQSGIVQIAYGFNKPVIATSVGGLPDVVTEGKTGYLIKPFDSDAIADAVIKCFCNDQLNIFTENIKSESERFSWDRINDIIREL